MNSCLCVCSYVNQEPEHPCLLMAHCGMCGMDLPCLDSACKCPEPESEPSPVALVDLGESQQDLRCTPTTAWVLTGGGLCAL